MNYLQATASAVIASLLLVSCSNSFRDARDESRSLSRDIDVFRETMSENEKVRILQRPPVPVQAMKVQKVEETITWLNDTVDLNSMGFPLSLALMQVKPASVGIWMDEGINPNAPVTINFSGSSRDALSLIASQTGYGIEPLENSLEVRRFESETFILPAPIGSLGGNMGEQGQTSSNSGGLAGGDVAAAESQIPGQFINVKYESLNLAEDISSAVRTLLKRDDLATQSSAAVDELVGSVQPLSSISAITVRTTPSRMRAVRRLVNDLTSTLLKQVIIDIRILEFRSNNGKEESIDWNLVKNVSNGTLRWFTPGTDVISQGASYGMAFSGTGRWDGTEAFIRALKMQGTVSGEITLPARLLNNRPGSINQIFSDPYLRQVKTQANENVMTAEVTPGVAIDGIDMMITPSVHDEFVILNISGKVSKPLDRRTIEVLDLKLEQIPSRSSSINFANQLRYGQTVVIASVKQSTLTTQENAGLFSRGKGINRETIETLVLLTPRRVN